jgi:uncharacterized membrane protein (DUF485 family)
VKASHRALLDSPEFHGLVARRWRMSLLLSALLFILYYGYIVLIAADRALLSRRLSTDGATTVAIPVGAAVILGAWVLTAVYVIWANRHYDVEAARLRARAHRD